MIIGSLFEQKQGASPSVTSKPGGNVVQPLISTKSPVLEKKNTKVEVSQPKKISDQPKNFIASLKLDQINLKKLGQSLVAGAKQLPSQLKQGAGVIVQGLVSQQKALDSFYQKVPTVLKPLAGMTPVFSGSSARAIRPEKVKESDIKTEKFGATLREKGFEESKKKREEFAKTFQPSEGLQKYLEIVAFNLPQVATTTGLTLATALITKNPALTTTVGLSTSYGLGASEVYDEARSNGLSDKDSLPLAQFGGAIIGALDFIPLERLIKKTGAVDVIKKSIIKKIAQGLISTGTQAGFEGITEGTQEIVSNAIASTYKENQNLFEGVKEASIVGALLGGVSDLTLEGVLGIKGKGGSETAENINTAISSAIETPAEKRTEEQKQIVSALFTQDLTPDQLMTYVTENDLAGTEEGKTLVKTAYQAQQNNQNIKLTPSEDEKSFNVELVSQEYVAPEKPVITDKSEELQEKEVKTTSTYPKVMSTDELLKIVDERAGGFRTPEQVSTLRADIEKNGIKYPIELIEKEDGTFQIYDGNHRIQIAKDLKIKEVPVKITPEEPKVVIPKVIEEEIESVNQQQIETIKTQKDVKRSLKNIINEYQNLLTEAEGKAVVAQEQREGLNVGDIASLKRIYSLNRKFQEGDVETIRASKSGKLMDRVIENVKEKFPHFSEQEAFDYAINLPTKAEEKVKKTPDIKNIAKKGKALTNYLKILKQKQEALDIRQGDVLFKEWEKAMAIQERLAKVIEVPRQQLPQGEGEKRISRLEARVRDVLGKISQDQIDELGLATYNQLTKEENIKKAVEYVSENPEEALQVLAGEKEAPKGLLHNAIYIAMERLAKGDLALARRLASLSSTRMGQEISILTELDPESTVKLMRDIIKVREKVFQERYKGKTVSQAREKVINDIKSQIKKPDRSQWTKFINEIVC